MARKLSWGSLWVGRRKGARRGVRLELDEGASATPVNHKQVIADLRRTGIIRLSGGRVWFELDPRSVTPIAEETRLRTRAADGELGEWVRKQLHNRTPLLRAQDGCHWFIITGRSDWDNPFSEHDREHHRVDLRLGCAESAAMLWITIMHRPVIRSRRSLRHPPRLSYSRRKWSIVVRLYEEWGLVPETPRRFHPMVLLSSPWYRTGTGGLGINEGARCDSGMRRLRRLVRAELGIHLPPSMRPRCPCPLPRGRSYER